MGLLANKPGNINDGTVSGQMVYWDGTVWQFIDAGKLSWNVAKGSQVVDRILLDTTATPIANEPGLLQWNDTDGTIDVGLFNGEVTGQMFQEMFTKVRNASGYQTISNGQAVYISGRNGVFPTVQLARSDVASTARILGVATQDIASPAFGAVTTVGYVRGIKTNYTGSGDWGTTWVTGDLLWVSKTVAGQLTNVEPDAPHHSDIVGTVGLVGAAGIGSILITNEKHTTLEELTDVNGTALTTTGQLVTWDNDNEYFDFTYNINNYVPAASAPASAGASGVGGQIAYDADFIYVCVATDTWKRVGIATW